MNIYSKTYRSTLEAFGPDATTAYAIHAYPKWGRWPDWLLAISIGLAFAGLLFFGLSK